MLVAVSRDFSRAWDSQRNLRRTEAAAGPCGKGAEEEAEAEEGGANKTPFTISEEEGGGA